MKRLFEFVENDRILITAIQTTTARMRFYESLGLFEGAVLSLFLRDKKRVIVKIGKTKFAFSEQITAEILGKKL